MYDFLNFEGGHSPSPKSKPLGCSSEQGKVEEQGEMRREKKRRKSTPKRARRIGRGTDQGWRAMG